MKSYPIAILGGGMVAGYLAREIAKSPHYRPGSLLIVSADSFAPYERPPLSKKFLQGKKNTEDILIVKQAFYEDKQIDLRLNTTVKTVDTDGRRLCTEDGEDIPFERLVIAAGAHARRLGVDGESLPGVHTLHTLGDSIRLREAMGSARRAVVVGAGFIGMEVSAVLRQAGLETTLLFPEPHVWPRIFTERMADYFTKYYQDKGIRIEAESTLAAIQGKERAEGVVTGSGVEIPADLVVLGVGSSPVVEPVLHTGIEVANGILVNEFLESSVPGIFAAGDAASYYSPLFGRHLHTEHWDNAVGQGKHLARALLGEAAVYDRIPYFFSDEFDISFEFWGDATGSDHVVYRGKVEEGQFSAWWMKEERLVAAFVLNRPDEERERAQKWVRELKEVTPADLAI